MTILILFLFIATILFLGTIPTDRPWRRTKTAREEALHDQIQDAMNWSPDMFHEREDGRWFNARGEEAKIYTWEEMKELMEKENK